MEIMKALNDNMEISVIENPYKIWVIDNFLKEDVIRKIEESWKEIDEENWHFGYKEINGKPNILEDGMKAISNIDLMPGFLKEIMSYFHSDNFVNSMSKITKIDGLIPDKTMRWSGIRVMLPDSYQLIHSDARVNPTTSLTKELTCLLYLNNNYVKDTHEGCLEIWDDEMINRTHEIEPINNRMVIFVNSDTSFHGVPKVLKERRAITFSIMSSNESSSRVRALFVKRPEDTREVDILGKERAVIKGYENFSVRS